MIRSASSPSALSMMIAGPGSAESRRQTARPSSPGIITSSTIKSGFSRARWASSSLADATVSTA